MRQNVEKKKENVFATELRLIFINSTLYSLHRRQCGVATNAPPQNTSDTSRQPETQHESNMTKGDQRAADQQPVRTNKLPLVPSLAGTERRFINIDDLTPQSVWRVYGDSFASEKDLIRHAYTGSYTHTQKHTQPSVCVCAREEKWRWWWGGGGGSETNIRI